MRRKLREVTAQLPVSTRDLAVGFLLGVVLCGTLAVASVLVMWPEPDPLDCIAAADCPGFDDLPLPRWPGRMVGV